MTRALPALPTEAEKKKIAFGGQTLKLIALWFMLFDHIVTLFVPQHTLLRLLFKIPGGISAPLFFFCIARGFEHSRCKGAYCRRLFFFALLSHVPYILCFSYGFFEATSVLFSEALGACALLVQRQEKLSFAKKLEEEAAKKAGAQSSQNSEELSPVVPLDPLCLELGVALLDLVNKEKGAELLERITRIRREAAIDLGLVVPRIRIIDNLTHQQEKFYQSRACRAYRQKCKCCSFLPFMRDFRHILAFALVLQVYKRGLKALLCARLNQTFHHTSNVL